MTAKSPFAILSMISILLISIASADDKNQPITSPAGYTASWVNQEEGHAVLTLTLNGKQIAKIDGAKPVSFSPNGNILLVREAQADDDCRHYLLNLAKGEYEKEWQTGKELRIGGRFVTGAVWSIDGKTITLKNAAWAGEPATTVDVAKHCRQ